MSISDLSQLSGGRPQDLQANAQGNMRGVVFRAPANLDDGMSVQPDGFNDGFEIAPYHWKPRGTLTPVKGEECILGFDSKGDAWVLSWAGPNDKNLVSVLGVPATNQGLIWNGARWVPSNVLAKANNLSDVASRTAALANLGIARGSLVMTTTAGTGSTPVATITHGLGAAPSSVVATADQSEGGGEDLTVTVLNKTTTTFQLQLYAPAQGGAWGYGVNWTAVL